MNLDLLRKHRNEWMNSAIFFEWLKHFSDCDSENPGITFILLVDKSSIHDTNYSIIMFKKIGSLSSTKHHFPPSAVRFRNYCLFETTIQKFQY